MPNYIRAVDRQKNCQHPPADYFSWNWNDEHFPDRTTILRLNATSIIIYEYQWITTISFLEIKIGQKLNAI